MSHSAHGCWSRCVCHSFKNGLVHWCVCVVISPYRFPSAGSIKFPLRWLYVKFWIYLFLNGGIFIHLGKDIMQHHVYKHVAPTTYFKTNKDALSQSPAFNWNRARVWIPTCHFHRTNVHHEARIFLLVGVFFHGLIPDESRQFPPRFFSLDILAMRCLCYEACLHIGIPEPLLAALSVWFGHEPFYVC